MIELNSTPPSTDEVKLFFGLLNICGDAEGSRKRVSELHAAAAAAEAGARTCHTEQDRLSKARIEHDEYLRKTRAELDTEIKTKRAAHQTECSRQLAEIRRKTAEADRLNERARTDAQAAAELKADLENRLQKLKSIAA
jgi:hypothetical protein